MKTEKKVADGFEQEILDAKEDSGKIEEGEIGIAQQENHAAKEEPTKNHQKKRKRRFKPDKKQIQGFVAGFLAAVILLTSVTAAINPGFLVGTFTKQVGNTTLNDEVDLQTVACEPSSLPAQTSYDQTFLLSIDKSKIKSMDKKYVQLGGLFQGMAVENVSYSDSDNRLAVAVKGNAATTHAYGSDKTNPAGEIYIMPDALNDSKTAYQSSVTIEYPQLTPDTSLLENNANFNGSLSFTLSGDTFAKTPAASDVTLSGGFSKMKVVSVSAKGQKLTVDLSGDVDSDNGNGIITLAGSTLGSGFSVDQVITVAGAASILAYSSLTTEEKVNDQVDISLQNDLFADKLTSDMFTLGEALAGYTVTSVRRQSPNMATVTITGGALLKPGTGTITIAGKGVQTGRTVSGKIFIKNPSIQAYLVKKHQTGSGDSKLYDVYSTGNDFASGIHAADIVLKGGLSGLSIAEVKRLNGHHIQLTVNGTPGNDDGIISVRSGAMGGVTGAEATVYAVDDMGLLDAAPIPADDTDAIKRIYGAASSQTGGFLDDVLDWGIGKVKDVIVSGIEDGLKEGAKTGLEYFLRQTGLEGPDVSEQLAQIQQSIDKLSAQMTEMETRILNAINHQGVQAQLASIIHAKQKIRDDYNYYMSIKKMVEDFKAKNPNGDPYQDPAIKRKMDTLAGPAGLISQDNIQQCVKDIGDVMGGDQYTASLIETYYGDLKANLPFEHNSIIALHKFVDEMLMYQAQGALLYAEYCNYNDEIPVPGTNQTLKAAELLAKFNSDFNTRLTQQENVLNQRIPSLDNTNVHNAWGSTNSGDFRFKCNYNNGIYVMVGDIFKISQFIDFYHPGLPDRYEYRIGKGTGIMRDIYINRGLTESSPAYDLISKDDANMIFKNWNAGYTAPYNYLVAYLGGNNGWTPDGWLFLEPGKWYIYWARWVKDVPIYNLFDGGTETYNSWELYDHHADTYCKVMLVAR